MLVIGIMDTRMHAPLHMLLDQRRLGLAQPQKGGRHFESKRPFSSKSLAALDPSLQDRFRRCP